MTGPHEPTKRKSPCITAGARKCKYSSPCEISNIYIHISLHPRPTLRNTHQPDSINAFSRPHPLGRIPSLHKRTHKVYIAPIHPNAQKRMHVLVHQLPPYSRLALKRARRVSAGTQRRIISLFFLLLFRGFRTPTHAHNRRRADRHPTDSCPAPPIYVPNQLQCNREAEPRAAPDIALPTPNKRKRISPRNLVRQIR